MPTLGAILSAGATAIGLVADAAAVPAALRTLDGLQPLDLYCNAADHVLKQEQKLFRNRGVTLSYDLAVLRRELPREGIDLMEQPVVDDLLDEAIGEQLAAILLRPDFLQGVEVGIEVDDGWARRMSRAIHRNYSQQLAAKLPGQALWLQLAQTARQVSADHDLLPQLMEIASHVQGKVDELAKPIHPVEPVLQTPDKYTAIESQVGVIGNHIEVYGDVHFGTKNAGITRATDSAATHPDNLPQLELQLYHMGRDQSRHNVINFETHRSIPRHHHFGIALENLTSTNPTRGIQIRLTIAWRGHDLIKSPSFHAPLSTKWKAQVSQLVCEQPAVLTFDDPSLVCIHQMPKEWDNFRMSLEEHMTGYMEINYGVASIEPPSQNSGTLRIHLDAGAKRSSSQRDTG